MWQPANFLKCLDILTHSNEPTIDNDSQNDLSVFHITKRETSTSRFEGNYNCDKSGTLRYVKSQHASKWHVNSRGLANILLLA
jgi:hypothetical protein